MQITTQRERVLVSWSGGKDSCLALRELMARTNFHVEALLTTVTRDFDRISMHGVRRELLERQAASLGLPLKQVLISKGADNAEYEARFGEALEAYKALGIRTVAFGDLFLEEIKAYRDRLLARHGMTGLYPIWRRDTALLIRDFIAMGFKAVLTCVDPKQLDPALVGRVIDESLLNDLPPQVDPCGENGEFHTFVFDGPIFKERIRFYPGEIVCRDSFWFCDLVPET